MRDDPKKTRSSLWRELGRGEVLRDAAGRGFRIVQFLAEGGYSQVYEAEHEIDPEDHPHVAIKVLHLKHAKNKKTLRRQMREAETLYKLRHPNVVRVHTIGMRDDTGMVFMVMDLLVGRTMRDLVRDLGGRMPIPWTLEIMIAVAKGLSAIHAMAVHRDLKPENVHVRDDGHISLFDLGTSRFQKEDRLTTQGYTIGTLNYMSPEQLSGAEELDGRSDLFAIGTMLYELLGGENPFAGKERKRDRQEIGNRIMFRPHTPLDQLRKHGPESDLVATNVPDYLVAIVERLLRKKADDRYASAAIVSDLLSAALAKFTVDNKKHPALPISTLGDVPRTPEIEEVDEPEPVASVPTSTNPFISISFPPDQTTRENDSAARPAASLAYASTEQIATYVLPATRARHPRVSANVTAEVEASELIEEGDPEWHFESVAKLDRAPVEETGPDAVYMDPDARNNTTLSPHAKRSTSDRSLPTERVRVRSAPRAARVPPVFLYMVGLAAMIIAALFLLGSLGLIGHRPAVQARTAPLATVAPAPEPAPSAKLEARPEPPAPKLEVDAGAPAPTPSATAARPRSRPVPRLEVLF